MIIIQQFNKYKQMKTTAFALLFFLFISALSAQEARYEIKSAIIKKTTEMMGRKTETVQYIDNYGHKEATTGILRTVTIGDTIFTINTLSKTGTKIVRQETPVNFLKLTPEMIDKNEIKEEGREEIAGKMCIKYSMAMNLMGQQNVTSSSCMLRESSRKREFHPIPLTEPYVIVSHHTALIIQPLTP